MVNPCVKVLALTLLCGGSAWAAAVAHGASPKIDVDTYSAGRATAARTLAARGDANSLATAAALTYLAPSRSKADSAKAGSAALELAVKASTQAPDNPAIGWLRLQFCANTPGCDIRDAATTMRWVDADNGAAWLPTLATAQRDKDTIEIDRVLTDMGKTFVSICTGIVPPF